MIVLDTTVLIYAKGADHSLRSPCQALLTAVAADGIEATTTPEVIQEFVHVWARRRTRGEAATLARAFVDLLSPLLVQEEPHLVDGIALFERHSRLGAFDAVLAAAAIESGRRRWCRRTGPSRGFEASATSIRGRRTSTGCCDPEGSRRRRGFAAEVILAVREVLAAPECVSQGAVPEPASERRGAAPPILASRARARSTRETIPFRS